MSIARCHFSHCLVSVAEVGRVVEGRQCEEWLLMLSGVTELTTNQCERWQPVPVAPATSEANQCKDWLLILVPGCQFL